MGMAFLGGSAFLCNFSSIVTFLEPLLVQANNITIELNAAIHERRF